MLGVAAVMSVPIMHFISHNTLGASQWDKCRSYCCDHQEDVGQHRSPFSIGSHGVLVVSCCAVKVDNWYQVTSPVARRW